MSTKGDAEGNKEAGAPEVGREPAEGDKLLAKDAAAALSTIPPNPDALKGRLTFPLLFAVAASACGSSFAFGYNIGVVNAPAELVKLWIKNQSYSYVHGSDLDDNRLTQIWSWTVSTYAIGGIFGGLLCGFVAEKLGRKMAMLMNNFFCITAGLLMGLAKTANYYPMLILGRIIIGFNCGLNSGLAPMYLTEIAPVNYRGMLGSFNQLLVVVSIWVSNLLGFDFLLGNKDRWPFMFAFTIVPAVWQLLSLPFCPESPKYLLIVKNRSEEAEKVLKRLRQKEDVSAELKVMQDEADALAKVPKVTFSEMFKNSALRWALVIAVMMMLAQQLSGINAAMFFSGSIFKETGLTEHNAIIGATLGMNTVNLVMTIIATAVVDRLGRRILMLGGMGGMLISSILIVIFLDLAQHKYPVVQYLAIVGICLFVAAFAIGPGPIPWFFVNELFDQGARGNANAVAVCVNWLGTFIVGQAFEPWKNLVGHYAFLAFSVFLVVFGLFIFFYVPETKGRQLDEVKEALKQKAPC